MRLSSGQQAAPIWAALAVVALTACGEVSNGASAPSALDGEWQLAAGTVDGQPLSLIDSSPVTLEVRGTEATGRSACNSYSGALEADGSVVRLTGLGGTEMACERGIMILESTYVAALALVDTSAIEADQLTLSGPGVLLVYEPIAAPADASLTGTRWRLESVHAGPVPDASVSSVTGEPAVLFGPDAFVATSACGRVEGGWNDDDGRMETSLRDATDRPTVPAAPTSACTPETKVQDEQVRRVLGGAFRAAVAGDVLTLTLDDGAALTYRAPTASATLDGWWLLRDASVDSRPMDVTDLRATLAIDADGGSATVGCNDTAVTVGVDDPHLTIALGPSTSMYCEDLSERESHYSYALSAVTTYRLTDDILVMSGSETQLTFEPLPPIDVSPIIDRRWVIESLSQGGADVPLTQDGGFLALHSHGEFEGSTGACEYSGRWVAAGDRLTFPTMGLSDDACPDTDEAQGSFVLASFSGLGGFVPAVDGELMTVTGEGGETVVYRDAG